MKKSGCAIIALFVAVCASMFVNLLLFVALAGVKGSAGVASVSSARERSFEEVVLVEGGSGGKKVAVIPLDGVIAHGQPGSLGDDMVEDFKNALEQAQNDPEVQAVVISVDSPGGEITASDVLFHSLRQFSKHKPSVVYFNSIGASGAYYTACGANYIMCNATTFTGSIGVIISTLNYRDLFGKIGLESVVFKSGKFKDMLNGAREMTADEKAYVEGLVMQSYDRFVGIVAKARGLDEQGLRNGVADGRILSGTDALEARLVNQLGYIEDAYAKARELGKVPDAEIVRYKRSMTFASFLRMFGEARVPEIKVDVLQGLPRLQPGRVYLLPPFFAP
ncbi:MAG TPA: signal peptide peptidase SppA [Terrimicrobiaceae bacterium]|nr:signal peptide peptidase SppA [Terrimicrobiaceae bacterium]